MFFCAISFLSESAVAAHHCLKTIQAKAITERMAKTLPIECQAFRKSYLRSLRSLSQSPQKFSHELAKEIQSQKSFQPPYSELVIASIAPAEARTPELISAIEARAKIEEAKKVKYTYGVAALEKIQKGQCRVQFSDPAYEEVCLSRDEVFARVSRLQAQVKSTDTKKAKGSSQ